MCNMHVSSDDAVYYFSAHLFAFVLLLKPNKELVNNKNRVRISTQYVK
jgi:hypothetical protein